jgi:hypothetical protein
VDGCYGHIDKIYGEGRWCKEVGEVRGESGLYVRRCWL